MLLAITGADALDLLLKGRTKVSVDWLLGASIERKLLRLVGQRLDVTLKVFEAELAPWVARTVASPTGESTVKLAENSPLVVVVTVDGIVVIALPLNFIVTVELGANPAPAISTDVPTGPEDGLKKMTGTKDVTVKSFEGELDP